MTHWFFFCAARFDLLWRREKERKGKRKNLVQWTIVSNAFILSFKLNWESCFSHYLEPNMSTIPFDIVVFNSKQWRDFIRIQRTNLSARLAKLSCVCFSSKPEENWDDDGDDDNNDTWKYVSFGKFMKSNQTHDCIEHRYKKNQFNCKSSFI